MHGRQVQRALAATALALGAGAAAAIDFDDPNARPLHFAMETLSEDFVTRFVEPGGQVVYYNLEVPPDAAELTTTTKLPLFASRRWYVRVDLLGMVFSATPVLSTRGAGAGDDFESTDADVVRGVPGEPYVIYRLPNEDFAQDLTFSLSIGDTLAVPPGAGRYRAAIALYDDLGAAFDRDLPPSRRRAFGGEKIVVVMTSGLEVGFESAIAVADVDREFLAFTPESASGASTGPDNPSAPAVLGIVAVRARQVDPAGRLATVYAARGGRPVAAEDLIESVAVTIAGDMTFGTFDLRTGTPADRCLYTTAPGGTSRRGGAIALSPPAGEAAVTTVGTATVAHRDEPFGTRNLCVWLPLPEPGEDPEPIPIGLYEATVSVAPAGGGHAIGRAGVVGDIRHSGARVQIAHLTTSDRYDQQMVILNRGRIAVRFSFVSLLTEDGATVELSREGAAARDSGLHTVPAGSQVVLSVAATLRIRGGVDSGDRMPLASATLAFNANANDIQVATVQTNRGDGSTDTVVYRARSALDPEDSP